MLQYRKSISDAKEQANFTRQSDFPPNVLLEQQDFSVSSNKLRCYKFISTSFRIKQLQVT